MNFRKISSTVAVSDCGRYELRGKYTNGSYFWNGFDAATGRLIAASSDKEFVQGRCEFDSLHVEHSGAA